MNNKNLLFGLLAFLTIAFCSQAADILLVNGQKWDNGPSAWEVGRACRSFADFLRKNQLSFAEAEQENLTETELADCKVAAFPCSGPLNDAAFNAVSAFVEQGGKLLIFCNTDQRLLGLLELSGSQALSQADLVEIDGIKLNLNRWHGAPENCRMAADVFLIPLMEPDARGVKIIGKACSHGELKEKLAIVSNQNGVYFAPRYKSQNEIYFDGAVLSWLAQWMPNIWPKLLSDCREKLEIAKNLAGEGKLEGWCKSAESRKLFQEAKKAEVRAAREGQEPGQIYAHLLEAIEKYREAYVIATPSRKKELRGVWIHNPKGINGWGWDKTAAALEDNGFNALFANLGWSYVADYFSDVLPVHPDVSANNADYLQECLLACKKHNLELHVWKVAWNMGQHTPEKWKKMMRDEERTQVRMDGSQTDYLAPHLLENVDLEVAAWLEIAEKYPVAGLHLDYIRYPDAQCDFSESARRYFEYSLGRRVENWPDDCLKDGCDYEAYNEWRRANVTRLVRRLSRELQQFYPEVKLSAAVYGNWDNARYAVAQDAADWVSHGYLDFICPMNYEKNMADFLQWTTEQEKVLGDKIPFYPGIGAYLLNDAADCNAQIIEARRHNGDGFLLFQHSAALANQVLPLLGKGAASESVPTDKLPHNNRGKRKNRRDKHNDEELPLPALVGQTIQVEMDFPDDCDTSTVAFTLWRNGLLIDGKDVIMLRTAAGVTLSIRNCPAGYYRWNLYGKNNDGSNWNNWSQAVYVRP